MKEFLKSLYNVHAKVILCCSLTVSSAAKIKRNCSGKLAQVMAGVLASQKEMAVLLFSSLLTVRGLLFTF